MKRISEFIHSGFNQASTQVRNETYKWIYSFWFQPAFTKPILLDSKVAKLVKCILFNQMVTSDINEPVMLISQQKFGIHILKS